jgi:hypothetical protein
MRDLTERFGGSLGATQAVVARLEQEGAIRTTSRGRRGAVLDERALGLLWAAAREEPFVIILPLPSTRRIHALATAIKACLTGAGIEAYLGFIRGSQKRLVALRALRCHAVVTSSLAASATTGPGELIAIDLPPGSYVLEHRVLRRVGQDGHLVAPERVGVDTDSLDFQRLSDLEFAGDSARVSGSYMHLTELLNQGLIDAMVWDVEETFATPGPRVADVPLSDATRATIGTANTSASIVVRRDDVAAREVVRVTLDDPVLAAVQREVLEGARTAEY